MDKETYEKQKAFAGEKIPSMNRRCVGHDYQGRQIYMLTMVTEGRRPLFGHVAGRSDGAPGTPVEPHVVLTELGRAVVERWWATHELYPEIEVLALQMMPDHLHGILFVKERMDQHLGQAIKGFKTGCNKAYRRLVLGDVQSVATWSQQTEQAGKRSKDDRHGLLFARGYNDRLLLREGQLDTWLRYLADNPRRLLMKREHPDLFRVQRGLIIGSQSLVGKIVCKIRKKEFILFLFAALLRSKLLLSLFIVRENYIYPVTVRLHLIENIVEDIVLSVELYLKKRLHFIRCAKGNSHEILVVP